MTGSSIWRNKLLMVMVMLLAVSVLASCGRGKKDNAEAPAEQPAAEAPVAEEPVAEAPTDQEAVEAKPAEEETVAEQPAAEEPAAEESAAEEPAEETAQVQPAAGGPIVEGACNHPYYPIRDGAIYHYRVTSTDSEPVEMTTQYKVTGPDSFVTVQNIGDEATTEMSWRCTEEGLLSTDFGLGGLGMKGVEYTMDKFSGVTVPLPEKLQVGNQWQSLFNMSSSVAAEGMEMNIKIETVTDYFLTAFEEITTPAGTFDAAKIDTTTTVDMKMDMGDMGDDMPVPGMEGSDMKSTMWLAEGVGMVKSVSGDEDWSSVTELISIE